jgi:hypothetical protein
VLGTTILIAMSAAATTVPQPSIAYIEQIGVAARKRMEATRQIPMKIEDQRRPVAFNQLPSDLQQSNDANENELASKSSPEASLTADVLRAWNQIRGRGQTPSPDLIAREIGPDRLAEFLATSPAAASVLATGTLPDTQNAGEPPTPAPDQGK